MNVEKEPGPSVLANKYSSLLSANSMTEHNQLRIEQTI